MAPLFQFRNLSRWPRVVHGIGDRYTPGNIGFEFGGLNEVLCARGELMEMVNDGGQDLKRLVSARQTHSDHILVYREGDILPERAGAESEIADIDAFITDVPGIGFMVKTADCQPILMAGRNMAGPVVAAVHAGWRGSLKNIAGKTMRKMVEEFGVDPATIEAGVGPSLGPCCAVFEDESVLREATTAKGTCVFDYRVLDQGKLTHRFDFWAMTRDQLMKEGVREAGMEFCGVCTVCHKNRWFSFRGDQPDCGRFGSVVGLC